MDIKDWEQKIKKWDLYPEAVEEIVDKSSKKDLVRLILLLVHYVGLVNEIGELGGKIKKEIRDDRRIPTIRDPVKGKEVGDGEWYLTIIEHDLGYTKNETTDMNDEKLQKREDTNKMHGSGDHREDD